MNDRCINRLTEQNCTNESSAWSMTCEQCDRETAEYLRLGELEAAATTLLDQAQRMRDALHLERVRLGRAL